MRNTAAANRYARALLEVTVREGDPRAVERELAELVAVFDRTPVLRRLFLNPAVPHTRKQALAQQLVSRMQLSPVLVRLIAMLAERDKLVLLPQLLPAFRKRLRDHLGVVEAEVRTAVPLPPDRLDALRRRLADVTGRQVEMTAEVDPSIIGGVVARVESTIYDGSIMRQLAKFKERFEEGA